MDELNAIDRLKFDQLTLKTAQENLSDRVSRLEDLTQELREVIYGDRRKKVDGLVSVQDEHDAILRKINAVFFQDQTGQKGYLHDVDVLMGRYKEKNEIMGLQWQFWGVILAALITGVFTFVKWDSVVAYIDRHDKDPVAKKLERAKHKKGAPIIEYRYIPADPDAEEK